MSLWTVYNPGIQRVNVQIQKFDLFQYCAIQAASYRPTVWPIISLNKFQSSQRYSFLLVKRISLFLQLGTTWHYLQKYIKEMLSYHTFFCLSILVRFHKLKILNICWACSQNCEKRLLDSLCLSFSLSVRMEQLCPHWTEFHAICYEGIFWKYVEEIKG